MRESMARLTPLFSANRTVREYTERHYLPAAAAYGSRASGTFGPDLLKWAQNDGNGVGAHSIRRREGRDTNQVHVFEARVYLTGSNPDAVRVEVYADLRMAAEPFRQVMQRGEQADLYTARVPVRVPPATTHHV